VRRCALLHLAHIANGGDPFELGSSRPLDYGHWAAHKLESLTGFRLRHGEAVSVGLALDSRYSVEIGLLDRSVGEAIATLLEDLGLPTWDDALDARDENGHRLVFAGLREFREHLGGELTITLLQGIARPTEAHEVDERAMERAMAWLRSRQPAAGQRSGWRTPVGAGA
jgi:3-dehydroquinate synthase